MQYRNNLHFGVPNWHPNVDYQLIQKKKDSLVWHKNQLVRPVCANPTVWSIFTFQLNQTNEVINSLVIWFFFAMLAGFVEYIYQYWISPQEESLLVRLVKICQYLDLEAIFLPVPLSDSDEPQVSGQQVCNCNCISVTIHFAYTSQVLKCSMYTRMMLHIV